MLKVNKDGAPFPVVLRALFVNADPLKFNVETA
jgi:hypothetical protein